MELDGVGVGNADERAVCIVRGVFHISARFEAANRHGVPGEPESIMKQNLPALQQ